MKLLDAEGVHLSGRQNGFSFIEILVVMLIAVTLYAVALKPSEAMRRKREMAQCAENLRKLHLTLNLYAAEHDGAYPVNPQAKKTEDALRGLAPRYTTDATFLSCPVERGGYSYAMGLRKDGGTHLLAADRLTIHQLRQGGALFSAGGNHGDSAGNLLFTDGHVEVVGATAPRELNPPPGVVLLNP